MSRLQTWKCHQGRQEQTFRDSESRAPVVFQNIKTDAALVIDIAVVDLSLKLDTRRFEGVVRRELNRKKEDTSLVRAIFLRTSTRRE